MNRFFTTGAALLLACSSVAQSPQFSVGISGADSVPQTTIVPVQQPAVQVVERTTVYEEPERGMDRAQRRAWKATGRMSMTMMGMAKDSNCTASTK